MPRMTSNCTFPQFGVYSYNKLTGIDFLNLLVIMKISFHTNIIMFINIVEWSRLEVCDDTKAFFVALPVAGAAPDRLRR